MLEFLRKLLSFKVAFVLMLLYGVLIAIATIIESLTGTANALKYIYHAPVVWSLLAISVASFAFNSKRYITTKCYRVTLIHFGFITILCGAIVSHYFSSEGIVHLRVGEQADYMFNREQGIAEQLPFTIKLESFKIDRYVGSNSPSSYQSRVVVKSSERGESEHTIAVNRVLDYMGYRIFQTSFDSDENGTVLTVNRDRWGHYITYLGYFILFLGLLIALFSPNGQIGLLFKRLGRISLIVLLLLPASVQAKNRISKQHAELFGSLPMASYRGRVQPVNSFASDLLRKVYKQDSYEDYDANSFLLSLLVEPEIWQNRPIVSVDNRQIAERLNLSGKYASFNSFFDNTIHYIFANDIERIYATEGKNRSSLDKEILKIDERLNLLYGVMNGSMVNIFPCEQDASNSWYSYGDDLSKFSGKDSLFVSQMFLWYIDEVRASMSSGDWSEPDKIVQMIATYSRAKSADGVVDNARLKAEVTYNRLDIFNLCKKLYLILGGVLFLLLLLVSLVDMAQHLRTTIHVVKLLLIFVILYHLLGLALRWYVAGYAPWSNSYETMVLVSLLVAATGYIFVRKEPLVCALATIFAGVVLFVASLNWMDPQIGSLVPVLKSPWLMFHVAVVMAAYGCFGLSAMVGITGVSINSIGKLKPILEKITIVNQISMWIGLILMTIGTFLGAIWANESWGRYWGWDPKESWALVTIIVYALITHMYLFKKRNSNLTYNILSIIGFLVVLMTYFGVNYLLTGLHSYS